MAKIFRTKTQKVSHIVQPTTSSMLGVCNSDPQLATYVWYKIPGTLALAVLSPSAPTFN